MTAYPYYRTLSAYLRERLGGKAVKIALDGGFTCPNRDGTLAFGGCRFCSERGAGEFAESTECGITAAVKRRLAAPLGGRRADRYIAYFQSFSGTYASPAVLRRRYDAALSDPRVVGLAVATRPDCIDEEKANLLAEYAQSRYVSVELGLQTASDEVAARMNIACPRASFSRAVRLLSSHGIDTVAHILVGLPGEGRKEALATLDLVNSLPVTGIKIHSLYVTQDSALAEDYLRGDYTPLSFEEYTETVVDMLSHARPDLVIHRLTGDPEKGTLLSPSWCIEKHKVLAAITQKMRERGLYQGCLFVDK